eukprot:TRINITY_DN323_c0_g2_i4.p1 TRINITY_DN323_c0_g2~~TRINITY_DN323_c0_g2_i4.p1  ORF type:complete len:351 (+),score=125.45 TRINITY_DN323_c0_g2_i4:1279-2331(+)
MPLSNKRVIYLKAPTGFPVPNQDTAVDTTTVSEELPENSLLLKNLYLSLDPYMRGRMRDPSVKSYAPAFTIGDAMTGGGVSEVFRSTHPDYKVGDIVQGMIGWEEYTTVISDAAIQGRGLKKLPAEVKSLGVPLSYFIGVLGMPGLTAYVGLHKFLEPKSGETLFISAAAGAVGQLVGQLGKILGLRVVGSAGEDEKVEYLLKELKFDAAFNYKKVDTGKALKEFCPNGIDLYFENVGGETLDHVLTNCNKFARIAACGMISQYNNAPGEGYGVKNLMQVVPKQIKISGFIIGDHAAPYLERFQKEVGGYLREGKVVYKEDVTVGLDGAQEAFVGMLKGKNFGKAVVKIA